MTSAVLRRQRRATFTVFLANGCGIGGWAAATALFVEDALAGDLPADVEMSDGFAEAVTRLILPR